MSRGDEIFAFTATFAWAALKDDTQQITQPKLWPVSIRVENNESQNNEVTVDG